MSNETNTLGELVNKRMDEYYLALQNLCDSLSEQNGFKSQMQVFGELCIVVNTSLNQLVQKACGDALNTRYGEKDGDAKIRSVKKRITTERVTCTACARVVCAIRNDPYNTLIADVDRKTLEIGMYDAVAQDGERIAH